MNELDQHNAESCVVCGHPTAVEKQTCQYAPYKGKTLLISRCRHCGLIRLPTNVGRFAKEINPQTLDGELRGLRNATDARPGREFHMAQMAIDIIQDHACEISFFGSGTNRDWQWVQRQHPRLKIKLVDLENMQDVAHFEPVSQATPSRIVIVSEVIEHFEEPAAHFKHLLGLLPDDGIMICSTNIYDGGNVSAHTYPFIEGHVAYWTPLALGITAVDNGCLVDFRMPQVAFDRGWPRKRYVIFSRSVEVMLRSHLYFGDHPSAPSEG